ncbi:hypothetical protein DIX60_01840 [Streptococcus iniae]|uniref:hypothetical protein n=1 Tax=Streptococcus iniae TaxID=1346 RepID=UPI00035C2C77|nr:hypothetical protein [Streptococcus iniae]ESR08670.1 hypothetical protein IUSA1_11310 [Streptococcus iniae IUSA1]RLV28412.1 hypothetical protein DIX60_01840 [Streptococcus iniae]
MKNKSYQDVKLSYFERKKQAIKEYILIRKIRAKQERDYFASEGESDPKRLEAQRQRDIEFLQSLKKLGVWIIISLIFYAILRTILGLW